MLVFGTRPEAIKMCPLFKELKGRSGIKTVLCVTGQHRGMLDGVLRTFDTAPDYDLSVMKEGQTLCGVTAEILCGLDRVLEEVRPSLVLLHGDTTTAFSSALACFYRHIPIGHVEAGLRTYDMQSPFPEEFNRRSISLLSDYDFAPTEKAKDNLLREGKPISRVFVTGNTVIDALKFTVKEAYDHPLLSWAKGSRLLLITAHRRESQGERLLGMLRAIRRAVEETKGVKAVYPVHMNPTVQRVAREVLGNSEKIRLVPPLEVVDFHNVLARSDLVLTDSGGIQEEATFLGKPVLVMRETTERPEGVETGALRLVGTSEEGVYQSLKTLLKKGAKAPVGASIYGDGSASARIADIIEKI